MNIEKHLHRTEVLNSILALWAEHEDLGLNILLDKFDLDFKSDEEIIKTAKENLKPKQQYYLIQVDPQNKHVLNGYDRQIMTQEEQVEFFENLGELPSNVIIYSTVQWLSESEYEGVKATIEEMYQSQVNALKGE